MCYTSGMRKLFFIHLLSEFWAYSIPDPSVCMAHHKYISSTPCYSWASQKVSINVYECGQHSTVTSQLESLGAISLERYGGRWEGQAAGDKRLFAFLLGGYWKGTREISGSLAQRSRGTMNLMNSAWTSQLSLRGPVSGVSSVSALIMPRRDRYAWAGKRIRMMWTGLQQGSERGDLQKQAMKDLEAKGVERKGVREGMAARDHRDLLGLWLRGKRKQRWLIKIMLALECVWHLDETVSLVSIQSNSCPDWLPSPKEKQLFPG